MGLFDLSPKTFTLLATIIGYMLIDDLTVSEQNSLGNFLMLVGQILETNASQAAVIKGDLNDRVEALEKQLQKSSYGGPNHPATP